jgi:preprotein translocase subunit SecE
MNAKMETAGAGRALDVAKLVLAAAVVAAGIAGYYYLADLASSWRMLIVLAAVVVAAAIAAFTAPGRAVRGFLRETQFEMRKVVWPTREETLRTTLVVIIVVILLSAVLGLIDVLLKWAILDHLLKLGT